jgi:serine/threonine protein kinase
MKILDWWVVDAVGSVRCVVQHQRCLRCVVGGAVSGVLCGVSCQIMFCHQRYMYSVDLFRFLFLIAHLHFFSLLLVVCTVRTTQVDVWSTGCVLLELLFGHRR